MQNGKALDVHGGKDEEGRPVIVWNKHNGANQKWKVLYIDKIDEKEEKGFNKDYGFHINRPFYIVSRMAMQRVVEWRGSGNVVISSYGGRDTQQFIFDGTTKTIISQKYKNKSVDISNSGKSNNLSMANTNARWFQMFRYVNGNIVNEKGKVFDVHSARDDENRQVIAWGKHNGLNQQWDIVYVDEWKPWPKKGELNEFFGFYVQRPFYIVSELPKHRYLDEINGNLVIKTPNGFDSQKWFFDQKTRTIKNVKTPSKSFDIQNAGRSTNLQIWNTNSGWF